MKGLGTACIILSLILFTSKYTGLELVFFSDLPGHGPMIAAAVMGVIGVVLWVMVLVKGKKKSYRIDV